MPTWAGIIVAAVLGIINLLYTISRNQRSDFKEQRQEVGALRDGLNALQQKVGVMEAQVQVFWRGVSFSSAQALHSPHSPVLDALIEKFQRDQIDDVELAEFKGMLHEIAEDEEETAFKRKSALEVLTLIKIRYEIKLEAVGA